MVEPDPERLDPRPQCHDCLTPLIYGGEYQGFLCPSCGQYLSLCDIWNWHKDRKVCIVCGAGKGVELGTVLMCFHHDEGAVTIHAPICDRCSNKPIDDILEVVQECDLYMRLIEGGLEPDAHPCTGVETQGGLIIYV